MSVWDPPSQGALWLGLQELGGQGSESQGLGQKDSGGQRQELGVQEAHIDWGRRSRQEVL